MADTAAVHRSDHSSRRDLLWATISGALLFALLLITSRDFAMVWDEGHTVRRDRLLVEWFTEAGRAEKGRFDPEVLQKYWRFSRAEPDGHPPGYALIGVAGWFATHHFFPGLDAYRIGPIVVWCLAVALVGYFLARWHGRWTGLSAMAFLGLQPHLFANAHYAHYDIPMTAFWLLAQLFFVASLRNTRFIPWFGVCIGMSIGCKFTGVFAVVPALFWLIVHEAIPNFWRKETSDTSKRTIVIGGIIAIVVLYAIHPMWWQMPIAGPKQFLESNLTRSGTNWLPTLFLGTVYRFSLPWYNTWVYLAVCVPVIILLLGLLGLLLTVRNRLGRCGWIWLYSFLTLMIVRGLPNAPGHDGLRLFLPAPASLAILAALALGWIVQQWGRRLAFLLLARAFLEIGLASWQLYPHFLSYYNVALGGLPGAERVGLEPTFYWDTLGTEFFHEIQQRHAEARNQGKNLELRFMAELVNLQYLREWGLLPEDVLDTDRDKITAGHYVMQRRKGMYFPMDSWLEQNAKPTFRVHRQGVDLLRIYHSDDAARAFAATKSMPIPEHFRE